MRRSLRDCHSVSRLAGGFAQHMSVAHMHRYAALQIRQREGRDSVTAIRRAQQRKQRLILIDGHQLTVTQRPTFGCKPESEDPDLGKKWFCHVDLLSAAQERAGNTPCNAIQKLSTKYGIRLL